GAVSSNGSGRPPKITCAPPSVKGRGGGPATAAPPDRLEPVIEMIEPGATGGPWPGLAALTAAVGASEGGTKLLSTLATASAVPPMGGESSRARIVPDNVADAFRTIHSPAHRPSCCEFSFNGGSPFEKTASTEPSTMGWPQSSRALTSIRVGQPAVSRLL